MDGNVLKTKGQRYVLYHDTRSIPRDNHLAASVIPWKCQSRLICMKIDSLNMNNLTSRVLLKFWSCHQNRILAVTTRYLRNLKSLLSFKMAFITSTIVPVKGMSWSGTTISHQTNLSKFTNRAKATKRPRCQLVASIIPSVALHVPSLLVAEDITRQIFAGGMGIVGSGLVAVLIVGIYVSNNLESVSC